jgi:formylglycine-generating enzyme required for sulfatase activity
MKYFYSIIVGSFVAAFPLFSQTTPTEVMQMYAGLTITGTVGDSYTVQTTTTLGQPNSWVNLVTFVLSNSPCLWLDTNAPQSSTRFYRVVPTVSSNLTAPSGMVVVPAGSFVMGDSLDGETDAPTNTVFVSAFYMDANLVSYSMWSQVHQWAVGSGYSFDNSGSANSGTQPVQSVSWYDAVKWCNARSQWTGVTPVYYADAGLTQDYKSGDAVPYVNWNASGYRLPTEAEWEKAARGGLAKNRFPSGNAISESQANYYGDPADYSYDGGPAGYNSLFGNGLGIDTSPVGYFPGNGYGLTDMAGNVCQWCWDWYGPYASGVQTDPRGPSAGSYRVLRGGSWLINAYNCRAANRSYYYPALGGNAYGFRCVMTP